MSNDKLRAVAIAGVVALCGQAHAAGFTSDAIPQFLKSGGGCSAFWMDGSNGQDQVGQWYAIADPAGSNPSDPQPWNAVNRWTQVAVAWGNGRKLWVTDPSFVGITNMPLLIKCSVPGAGGKWLPNAVIYASPDQP